MRQLDERSDWGIGTWVTSDAMRRLAIESGWTWTSGPWRTVLAELVERSQEWDFRARLGDDERHRLTHIPAEVGGRVLDEEVISSNAAALGLAGNDDVDGPFTHVVALGGMALACLRRTVEADRRASRLGIDHVAVLTANRALAASERTDATEAGLGDLELESDAAVTAARQVFALSDAPGTTAAGRSPRPVGLDAKALHQADLNEAELDRRLRWSHQAWDAGDMVVEVVAAPSSDAARRRANTPDQLVFWAERAGISDHHRLLLVTTDHYVPAQHFHGIRVLGLRLGCQVDACGTPWTPSGPTRGAAYLQEIRSALLAAQQLIDAAAS